MRAMSASNPAHRCLQPRRFELRRRPTSVQESITQQAMSQKTPATGQTGSGQARLTLRDSNRREPRDWNGAPLSGSHLGPHIRPSRRCNKAVCREAVCSSFTLFAPPAHQPLAPTPQR
jgi:hypothetical protein